MKEAIGVYGLFNTCGVFVYDIDYVEDKVLAGINTDEPEWFDISNDYEGFSMGEWFIPFNEVMLF